jgi:hypothetical protein
VGFILTQTHGSVLNPCTSYSGGHGFKPQYGDRLGSYRCFLQHLGQLYSRPFFSHCVIKTQTERKVTISRKKLHTLTFYFCEILASLRVFQVSNIRKNRIYGHISLAFLDVFANLRKATTRFLISVRLRGTTRLL